MLASGELPRDALRIIDANLNRSAEGLRVIEDVARFVLEDGSTSARLKELRHKLVQTSLDLQRKLVWSRDAASDVGRDTIVEGEPEEKGLHSILVANSRRVQESLRVLEEVSKSPDMPSEIASGDFAHARFVLYSIERDLLARLVRRDGVSRLEGLCVSIESRQLRDRRVVDAARQVILGGARTIEFCSGPATKRDSFAVALELKELCVAHEVLFVVNGDLDVAVGVGADGLRVGPEGLPVAVARRLVRPDQLLGCLARTVNEAREAQADGADYVLVDPVWAASSTDSYGIVGTQGIIEVRRAISVPVVAICGQVKDRIKEVLASRADCIAVGDAVTCADNPEAATRELVRLIEDRDEQTNR